MNISHKIPVGDRQRNAHIASPAPTDTSLSGSHQVKWRHVLSGILIILTLFITSCGDATSLATVSTEAEGIEIMNVLHENGIDSHKEDAGEEGNKQWRIVLDQSWFGGSAEVALANQVLQDNGLPRPVFVGAAAGTDGGMFKDEATRKSEQLKEREADLQRKLRLLPGVIGVEVSIVEPEDSSININPYPSTASVLIISKDDPPNFDQATIRGLVARSVPKLNAESVYVAITTKPVRPVPWNEMRAQRRHKILDAAGIGVMFILASSLVVVLLQMRRQSSTGSALRALRTEPDMDVSLRDDIDREEASTETGIAETTTTSRSTNATGIVPTAS